MMNEMLTVRELQKALSGVAMPSGFAGVQGKVIESLAKSMGYVVSYDALGNLYCRKDSAESGAVSSAKGGLMLAAAMDTKGFLVTSVTEDKVKFNTIGAFEAGKLADAAVRFENGAFGRIRSAADSKEVKLSDLYISLEQEGEGSVMVGDAAVLCGHVKETGDGRIQAVHAQNLAACVALLKTMETLKDDPAAGAVTFVFLEQHWSGRMGIRSAVANVAPHTCILCGASEALAEGDSQNPEHPVDLLIGRGPAVRFRESVHGSDEATCKTLIAAAEAADIQWQGENRNYEFAGGVEAMSTGSRCGQSFLGIPVKDRDSVEAVYSEKDLEDCVQVLVQLCRDF